MPSLMNTDLVPVSIGHTLFLFYQDGNKILSAHTASSAWIVDPTPIAQDAASTGSAITAYYVENDVNLENKSTIHVLYMNQNKQLTEKAKKLPSGIWQNIALQDPVKNGPIGHSRVTSGAYNSGNGWNPRGSQWAYFVSLKEGKEIITEIRRTPKDPWYSETVLPQNFGKALESTSMAVSIVQGAIQLFFQDHDQNIIMYENRGSTWVDEKVYISNKTVQNNSPIASTRVNPNSKSHVFFANKSRSISHYHEGKEKSIAEVWSGTKLGAAYHDSKVTLFYKTVHPPNQVNLMVYDGSTWSSPVKVLDA